MGNLDVDPDGHVVVTDRGGHRVYRVFDDGRKQVIAGNGETKGLSDGTAIGTPLEEVRGIVFLKNGAYLLATHRDDQVWYVDTFGGIYLLLDGKGSADLYSGDDMTIDLLGEVLSEPRAVTLAPNGDLIVTERDVGFVRVLEKLDTPGPIHLTMDSRGLVSLNWPGDSDDLFVVETTSDLGNPNWTLLARVTGTDAEIALYRYPNAVTLDELRLFRVRSVPPDRNLD